MHEEPVSLGGCGGHVTKLRDLRRRFGEPEAYAAECSCGWTSESRHGETAEREARRDGRRHEQAERDAARGGGS
jgi:hypothetical protein